MLGTPVELLGEPGEELDAPDEQAIRDEAAQLEAAVTGAEQRPPEFTEAVGAAALGHAVSLPRVATLAAPGNFLG